MRILAYCALSMVAWAADPAFEVTSVKQNRMPVGQRNPAMECSPGGRFVAHGLSLRPVLLWAYHLESAYFQMSAVPEPVNSAIFDIEARAAGPVTQDRCKQMVQTLLVDRFKLSFHHESKEFSIYALLVGKNGPKMTKVTGETTDPGVGFTINGRPVRGAPAEGWSMERLAEMIGGATTNADLPVIDHTGLKGLYKIKVDVIISREDNTDLAGAVQQLGLLVEQRKEPFQVMAIDHIEMPDEN